MCCHVFSHWFPRLKLQQQDVQRCPRPLHTRDGVSDAQETCPMDMSPVAKAWQQNPPPEVPLDSQPPKRFARPISSVEIFADPSASSPGIGKEEKGSEKGEDGCPSQDPPKSTPPPAPATDLFHANEMVTRQEQFAEKEALEKESRKKKATAGEDPEEGPMSKAQKKAQKRKEDAAKKKEEKERVKAQKAAEKAAKKATAKAKAKLQKTNPKAKAEPKKKPAAKKPSKSGAKRKAKEHNNDDEDRAEVSPTPAEPCQEVATECPEVPGSEGASSTAAAAGDRGEVGRKSWAGRYRPANHAKGCRWDAIKDVFTQQLSSRWTQLSSMEAQY